MELNNVMSRILSPFGSKIAFESYELGDEKYKEKSRKVLQEIGIELKNPTASVPFPKMAESDLRVWGEYCPTKETLENISIGVPMQVLELIKTYKADFDFFEVWYESRDQVDPILVGVNYRTDEAREKKQDYSVHKFIMCRWGEALKPFSQIVEEVKTKWIKEKRNKLTAYLATLGMDADEHFSGRWVHYNL